MPTGNTFGQRMEMVASNSQAGAERARCQPGLYLIDADTGQRIVAGDVFPTGSVVGVVNGKDAGNREAFFTEIALALAFPDYFGRNWDAVYDCLTDLSWLPAEGYVLVFDGFGDLARNAPEQWRIGLKVFAEACRMRQTWRAPLFVLLIGPDELAPDIPSFPETCRPDR